MVGLHYDDLLVETVDVQVAVSRLSPEEQVARYVVSFVAIHELLLQRSAVLPSMLFWI
jgi:hypothetical protein